ncbi:MAG TPA: iron-sulfur cluster carrier protein ApbC [Chloroflexi bacterium]|nr:iron-sulfur cluster carrier protein ApbC [Chloroflexota bacterium]
MSDTKQLEEQVMARLATVMEPELHRDLVTLKMIRDLKVDGDTASFTIMLTTPACPLKGQIEESARQAVLQVPGIKEVRIKLDSSVSADNRVSGRLNLDIKNLIAVSSGKGGVGKSTIAANLAVALHQSGASVGLMDADILGPNLPMLMGIEGMPPPREDRLIPAEAYGVKVMSMGFLVDPDRPLIWRGPMVHGAIRQFFSDVEWGQLDYMIIDLPPGTGDAQLTLAQSVPLTGAIIVTQPQDVAVGDALRGLVMFEHVRVPIIGVIENMSGDFFGSGGGEKLAARQGVPFLGSVPLDPQVRIGGDSGKPIVATNPDSPAAQALTRIAQEVAARVSVINFGQSGNVIPIKTIG